MTETGYRRLVLGLLVLNTFLMGALAGGGLFYLSGTARQTGQRLPLAGEQLPAAERQALQKALSETRRALRSTQLEARQARVEAAGLMGKPDFDQAALLDALSRARRAESAVRAAVEARALQFAAGLSVDERRRLADGLIEREAPRMPAPK
ncbi:periplasmic heavy metal sensor [Rhizobium sp. SSA_523]|uniref:periplasmic heavy metal sensor n=1 Tax=Rhizobium sp. SSA_523 TaxID=2952477 RepID=UPI002090ECD9|nr:periplasmic heavy metal sensor [Rhizobium sp. SSA_523]MCO5730993.1 periplasmic heavy metal sensor [Rhizobium sp. SSA_523]WKC24202.1 periplasmic heavy metal sensor [Rhizobium sp. SSA_523]